MDFTVVFFTAIAIWMLLAIVAVRMALKRGALLASAAGVSCLLGPLAFGAFPILLSNGHGELGPIFVAAFVALIAALLLPFIWIVGILLANAAGPSESVP